ncbi:MAG: nucleotide exchange factor GrpE [Terricaulis sp.]
MSNDADTTSNPEAEADVNPLAAELAKAKDDLLRAMAETENTRRRAERQAQEARAYGIDRFARDLLPVADTLGRALAAAPPHWRESADDVSKNLLTGFELTERSLLEAFARHGLKPVGAKGDAFDPNLHQAIAHIASDLPSGTVAEVMQVGFVLADRTLRPAIVAVSSGRAEAPTVDIKV